MVERILTISDKIVKRFFISDQECIDEIVRIGTGNGLILDRSKIEESLNNNETLCTGLWSDPDYKLYKYIKES